MALHVNIEKLIKGEVLETGFPKIYDAMKRNESPEPVFETDDERSYFLAVLPVHQEIRTRGQAKGQAQKIDLSDTEKAVLAIRKGPCLTDEIVKELGLTKRTGALQRTL